VEKLKDVRDTMSNRQKDVEDHMKKVLDEQVAVNISNPRFILIVGLILEENVIAIPLILYIVY
jgi:hypothetical protein